MLTKKYLIVAIITTIVLAGLSIFASVEYGLYKSFFIFGGFVLFEVVFGILIKISYKEKK